MSLTLYDWRIVGLELLCSAKQEKPFFILSQLKETVPFTYFTGKSHLTSIL